MKGKRLASSRSHVGKEGVANQLRGEIMLGDLLWVRLRGTSWWPAQVVDANTVSESIKPSNRSVGEVLVRLYGSYKYLYVDPMKYRSEFENILKQYKGSYTEILKKALERDLSRSKSCRSRGQGSKSKVRVEVSNDETLKQNRIEENPEIEASKSRSGVLGKHPAVTVRGTRSQKDNLVAKSPKDVSENEGTKQHSVKKSNFVKNGISTQYQARVSPRRQSAANTLQTTVKNGNLLSEKTEEAEGKTSKQGRLQKKLKQKSRTVEGEAKCRTSKQNGVQKKPKPNSQSVEEEGKGKTSMQAGVRKKRKPNGPNVAKEAKGKTSMQAGVQKKRKPNGPNVAKEAKGKTSEQKKLKRNGSIVEEQAKIKTFKQDGVQNKLKRNSPSVEEEAKNKTPKQDRVHKKPKPNSPSAEGKAKNSETPKEDGMQKKLKPNSPNSAITSLGKSQELSARRMKVMQSLGLIAPSGSPFNRDGHI